MIHPYLSLEYPIRFAHRGSRVLWPENTMHAFQGAFDLGYQYFETDVRISRDGVVVVFHDKTLDRTTNATGLVSDWLFEDLRHLDAAWDFGADEGYPLRGSGIGIASLDELFSTFPDVHINIDLKGKGLEWPVAEIIRDHGRQERTLIGSFVDRRIARFRRVTAGEVATSAGPSAVSAMWTASRRGRTIERPVVAYQVPFNYRSLRVDQKYVDAIHDSGAQIHCWTVNVAEDMHRLLDMGVDGIVTDRPDVLNDVMRERGHDV